MRKLLTFVLTAILSVSIIFGQPLYSYAVPAAIPALASLLGTTVLTSAVGTATSSLVDSWLGVDRGYYNGSGSSTSFDYSNNMSRTTNLTAGGNITSSGANNENCWNTYVGIDSNTYSLVRNQYDTSINDFSTQIYNPTTNNYHTVNNVQYSETYNTYYMESNNYNYYVTNNYNYVSYYITNTTNNTTNYYEIYYELPDGRNSFYLTASEVWGEYFIYDVKRADVVAEDDGRTLALYHLDGNAVDSSYHERSPLPLGNGMYATGMFDKGIVLASNYTLPWPSYTYKSQEFTVEFFFKHNTPSAEQSGADYDRLYPSYVRASGLYHIVFQFSEFGTLVSSYVNGVSVNVSSFTSSDSDLKPSDSGVIISVGGLVKSASTTTYYTLHYFSPDSVLDEVRFSSGHVYSGDYINVPAQPFDTNEILVLPDEASQGEIIVAAGSDFSNYRIGGVRPTYPSEGFVHVILDEKGTVHDVQQFSAGAWDSVEAKIYKDNAWYDLKGFNLEHFGVPDGDDLNGTDSGGDLDSGDDSGSSGSGGGSVSGNGFGSFADGLGSIVDAVSGFFGMLLDAIGKIVTLITDFFSSFLTMFDGFTAFTEGFGNFLSSAFGFLPTEIVSALVVGINICIVIAIFKFMRH